MFNLTHALERVSPCRDFSLELANGKVNSVIHKAELNLGVTIDTSSSPGCSNQFPRLPGDAGGLRNTGNRLTGTTTASLSSTDLNFSCKGILEFSRIDGQSLVTHH